MKKTLKLNKVSLRKIADEQLTNVMGGAATGGGGGPSGVCYTFSDICSGLCIPHTIQVQGQTTCK